MALALTACNGKPKYMDDTTYNLGIKALETMDAYNNMEVDKKYLQDTNKISNY